MSILVAAKHACAKIRRKAYISSSEFFSWVHANMPRKSPSPNVELTVLLASRRRCCICFGLHGDLRIKAGQIAHLDHDPEHSEADNLAFVCLVHHDWLDSRCSQSKGATAAEAKYYRRQLYAEIRRRDDVGCETSVGPILPAASLAQHPAEYSELPRAAGSDDESALRAGMRVTVAGPKTLTMDVIYRTRDGAFDGIATMTWDEIFACVAPLMLGDTPESAMKVQLEEAVLRQEHVLFGRPAYEVTISNRDFQKIKVRIWSLGIARQSEKKRTLDDRNTYWTLTTTGERYLRTHDAVSAHA